MQSLLFVAIVLAAEPPEAGATTFIHAVDRLALTLLHERVRLAEMQESHTELHPALELQERRVARLEAMLERIEKGARKHDKELLLRQLQMLLTAAAAELELASDVYTPDHPRWRLLESRAAALRTISEPPKLPPAGGAR